MGIYPLTGWEICLAQGWDTATHVLRAIIRRKFPVPKAIPKQAMKITEHKHSKKHRYATTFIQTQIHLPLFAHHNRTQIPFTKSTDNRRCSLGLSRIFIVCPVNLKSFKYNPCRQFIYSGRSFLSNTYMPSPYITRNMINKAINCGKKVPP